MSESTEPSTQNNENTDKEPLQEIDNDKQAKGPSFTQFLQEATPYHQQIVEHFSSREKKVWAWFSNIDTLQQSFEQTQDALLKSTYRLTNDSHPKVYKLANLAMQRLNISVPITLYQANDGAMNAALFYIPKQIHIVFYGAILEKLSEQELLAMLGHELSHYILWTIQDNRYLAAQQLLEDSCQQAPNNNALYETARLYSLYTEIFADRGAVIASHSPNDTVTVLLKVMTGLSQVDANSFLEQANELNEKNETSAAQSHPELYLRALLAHKWKSYLDTAKEITQVPHTQTPSGETTGQNTTDAEKLLSLKIAESQNKLNEWTATKLKGQLNIHALDVLDQVQLQNMSHSFFESFFELELQHQKVGTSDRTLHTDLVESQLQTFFPDWPKVKHHQTIDIEQFKTLTNDPTIKRYFIALIFDIAHADKEQFDEVLARGAQISTELSWLDEYQSELKAIFQLTKRQIDKIIAPHTRSQHALTDDKETGEQS